MSRRKAQYFAPNSYGTCDPEILMDASWNPTGRIDANNTHFQALHKDIRKNGQIAPVVITSAGKIIDGHRRTAACRLLDIKVNYVVRDGNPHNIYQSLNATQRKISASDWLEIYIREPEACKATLRAKFSKVEKRIGRKQLTELSTLGATSVTFDYARAVERLCRFEDRLFDIAKWILEQRQSYNIYILLYKKSISIPVNVIIQCINNKQGLPISIDDKKEERRMIAVP
jgi:hypothetical protein